MINHAVLKQTAVRLPPKISTTEVLEKANI